MKVLNFSIYQDATNTEDFYDCKFAKYEGDIQVFITTPVKEDGFMVLYIEILEKNNDEWVFKKRTLPYEILNLEESISEFLKESKGDLDLLLS